VESFTPTFNVGGLASGLDTNAILEQLLAIERRPKTRLLQKQRVEEARQNALRDVKTRLQNLLTAGAGLRDVSTWGDIQTVESSETTKITATRTGGAAAGAYTVVVTQLARAAQVRQGSGAATSASADGTLSIQVGSGTAVDVSIAAGDDLAAIASKINSTSGIGVYATVVESRLYLSGKTTGSTETIAVSQSALADELKLTTGTLADTTITPQDVAMTVNGSSVTSSSNTVTTAIPGVTLTLKAQTAGTTITVGAPAADTEAVKKKIQAFVDQYNSTIDFVRSKLAEKPVVNPEKEDDLLKGVLYGDSGLASLLSTLRSAIADVVTGRPAAADQLSEVGITTGATTGSSALSTDNVTGKLVLDSTKLSEQLAARFSDVKALFTNATGAYASEGLSQRLERVVQPFTQSDGILASRISSQDSVISSLRARQADLDVRLAQREKALRAQFTALETALQQAQAQSSWLAGQIAALA
jgi:flagellar hook-associated protein 2